MPQQVKTRLPRNHLEVNVVNYKSYKLLKDMFVNILYVFLISCWRDGFIDDRSWQIFYQGLYAGNKFTIFTTTEIRDFLVAFSERFHIAALWTVVRIEL